MLPPDSEAAYRHVRIAIVALLGGLIVLMCIAELGTRLLFPRFSRIQHRIEADRRDANDIHGPRDSGLPTVLLIGNSLLLHGLEYPQIRLELAHDAVPVRYAIENTEYLDWYYAMRKLFASGVKPTKVVLVMNLGQLLSNRGLGEYSAYNLFAGRDLLAVARESGLDNTETSNLAFAHWSDFYASRANIRNYLLNIADPGYASALHALSRVPPVFPPESKVIAQARIRLRALNDLCRGNGSEFVFVVPPAVSMEGNLLLRAGALERIDVDAPVAMGALGADYFQDNFHLNQKGAEVFTHALSQDIRARLTDPAWNKNTTLQSPGGSEVSVGATNASGVPDSVQHH